LEASYPLPLAFPSNMKTSQYRIYNSNTIPGNNGTNLTGTPANSLVEIIIPATPNCFLDPSTSYLNVTATLSWTRSPNGTTAACAASGAGGEIGLR